jgi:hypothetical protein
VRGSTIIARVLSIVVFDVSIGVFIVRVLTIVTYGEQTRPAPRHGAVDVPQWSARPIP